MGLRDYKIEIWRREKCREIGLVYVRMVIINNIYL